VFVGAHTTGFEELSTHVLPFTPAWGADETGLEANQIISFARAYASTRPPGNYIPNQMPDITEVLSDGRLKALLLLGTNMLSSFADAGQVADGLDKAELVVCVDLFMNETARRFADVVLPGTAWLEELGFNNRPCDGSEATRCWRLRTPQGARHRLCRPEIRLTVR
jgi:anaerobic selenocysteine-containing dehydrogenase